ncbi:nucleotidyltransferase domain-containing protein [Winogradskyella undariae]|uniref:nucleotidyltransferase domain-containing protein n=1 Tax=Winogradskyella undariae TaxID=1285465 RepID=UPI0015C8DB55|nr:nucleotidyltransferase domain-containing protein [Winogradskyella undariae]QNK76938.1 nucleotidyltransferase domain-containing protein [Winogradskyella sp. PAMC22761]
MTIEDLKKTGSIIFESISGSRAYGLDTATSDTDIRGVFILPKEQFYSLNYVGQVNNETNDIAYYELSKFIELLIKNNPNIMELLNVPEECVLYKHPIFDSIKKEVFLSKLCKNTFANYAFTQIKKSRGLNKKIVNPVEKERKSVEDFCYVRDEKESILFKDFTTSKSLIPEHCGLVKLSHMKDCYNLFYSEDLNYHGIARREANEVCLSSVPKSEIPIAVLYFNVDGYSTYCKKYKEYWNWVEKRNEERYKSNISHRKNYDAKNMMHTFRLLHMAKEIGVDNEINVRRPDRDFLLSIKNAEFEYDDLVRKAEAIKSELDLIYDNSNLIDQPNLLNVNKLLYKLRSDFYNNNSC